MAQSSASHDSAPARFLDQIEEQRMDLSDEQLVAEAIEINHAGVGKDKTLERYQDHLVHFSQYLASVHGKTFYSCRSKHVRLFMGHLTRPGGPTPHQSRLGCEWCRARGYPNGRAGQVGQLPTARATYRRSSSSTDTSWQRRTCLTTTPLRLRLRPRSSLNGATRRRGRRSRSSSRRRDRQRPD